MKKQTLTTNQSGEKKQTQATDQSGERKQTQTTNQSDESPPYDSWFRAVAVGFSLWQPQQHTEEIQSVSPLSSQQHHHRPRRVRWQRGWFSGKAAGDANDSDKIMALDLRKFPNVRLVTK